MLCFGFRFVLFSVVLEVVLVVLGVALGQVPAVALPLLVPVLKNHTQDHPNHPQQHRKQHQTKNNSRLLEITWTPVVGFARNLVEIVPRSLPELFKQPGDQNPPTCRRVVGVVVVKS